MNERSARLALVVAFALSFSSIGVSSIALAAPTSFASPSQSPGSKISGTHYSGLTPDQKLALAAAKKSLASELLAAKSAFGLMVADAKANRDQAILSAGTDKKAIAAARTQFRSSLITATGIFQSAVTDARSKFSAALVKSGIAASTK
ncbi:MAG: hypothetical protein WCK62_02325 [Actinomycetes bacterium]